ncbi:MAG: TRAP transporter substrate-binding protein [Candidatus Rokuibacteriota bacterium]
MGRSILAAWAMLAVLSAGIAVAPTWAADIVIKAGHSAAATEPYQVGFEYFKKRVEELTRGKVEVQLFPNRTLGNERDMIEGLLLGTVHVTVPSNAVMAGFVPETKVFDLPFLFRDRPHMYHVMDGPVGMELGEKMRAKGFRLLAYYEAGIRHIMTNKKPLTKLDDLKGLKIRTMENPVHLDAFRAMGAAPLPMAYGEVYTALQQGVIDGAEAANTNYEAQKFYEVAPNWAMVAWTTLVSDMIMGEKFFQSLPADVQKAVGQAARESATVEREAYAKSEEVALAQLKAKGVKITAPDPEPFRKASQAVYTKFGGPEDQARLKKILETK